MNLKAMKQKNKLPNPSEKHWLLGNVGKFYADPLYYIQNASEEVGDIFKLSSPFVDIITITNPEHIKHVLQNNNKNYHKGLSYRRVKPLIGEGLLTSEDDFWRQQRRLAQPAFYKARLERLFEIMQETVQDFIAEWKEKYKDGDKVNFSIEMNRLALLIVSNALFQSDVKAEMQIITENLEQALKRAMERIQKPWLLPMWIPTPENLKEQKVLHLMKDVIRKIIVKRKSEDKSYDDLLDMLLHAQDEESGVKMTEKQLMDEVTTIFMAGHETTANALAYAFYLLNKHPEANQKLYKEGTEMLANEGLNFGNSRNLTYTKQVIQETLRMYPPAWVISRLSLAEDTIGDYKIPPRTNVLINIFTMHHLEKYWEEPEQFKPERFEEEAFSKVHKFVYFPFGGGPRLCIGEQFAWLEMILAITHINQAFSFEAVEGYELELLPLITLRPKEDIQLRIFHRE